MGSGYVKTEVTSENSKELNNKLASMIAEREKQDKINTQNVLTDKEYEDKYGKQPSGDVGKK
jgi:hypothetical protein